MPNKHKKSQRKGGRPGGLAGPAHMTFKTVVYVDEGKTADVSLQTFMTGCEKSLSGLPWRLVSARAEACVLSQQSTQTARVDNQPALVQMRLNDAKQENTESIKSISWMVLSLPRVRWLKMPSPNLWKEDEERAQALVSIDNLTFGGTITTRVVVYLQVKIEFGQLIFTNTQKIGVVRALNDDDPGPSTSSSPFSLV